MSYIVKLADLPERLDSLDLILDKIVEGDCLELMRRMPDKCVDAVITDPPYNYDVSYNGYKDDREDYLIWCSSWQGEVERIKSNHLFIFGGQGPKHIAFWASLQPGCVFCWYKPGNTKGGGQVQWYEWEPIFHWGKFYGGSDVFRAPVSNQGGVGSHPCPKPLDLILTMISRDGHSNIFYDPFLGSGTTAVAAKKLGRHFIGCEISPEYCRVAERRLQELDAQPGLFEVKRVPVQPALI